MKHTFHFVPPVQWRDYLLKTANDKNSHVKVIDWLHEPISFEMEGLTPDANPEELASVMFYKKIGELLKSLVN